MVKIVADVGERDAWAQTFGLSGRTFWPRNLHQVESKDSRAFQTVNNCRCSVKSLPRDSRMGAHPQNARSRYLATISTMEKVPVEELEAAPSESRWLWLLNAGDMAARARSGITQAENLPGSPVQIVELLAKVS